MILYLLHFQEIQAQSLSPGETHLIYPVPELSIRQTGEIHRIAFDSLGFLWQATHHGLFRFDGQENERLNLIHSETLQPLPLHIPGFEFLSNELLLLLTYQGFFVVETSSRKARPLALYKDLHLTWSSSDITGATVGPDGRLWVVSGSEMRVLDDSDNWLNPMQDIDLKLSNDPSYLFSDRDRIWVFQNQKLHEILFDGRPHNGRKIEMEFSPNSVYTDHAGNLWICQWGSLSVVKAGETIAREMPRSPGTAGISVRGMEVPSTNGFVMLFPGTAGILYTTNADEPLKKLVTTGYENTAADLRYIDVALSGSGKIYFAAYDCLVECAGPPLPFRKQIIGTSAKPKLGTLSDLIRVDDQIFMSLYFGNGLHALDTNFQHLYSFPYDMCGHKPGENSFFRFCALPDGNVAVTCTRELVIFNPDTREFNCYKNSLPEMEYLTHPYFRDLVLYDDSTLLVASVNGGLSLFCLKKLAFIKTWRGTNDPKSRVKSDRIMDLKKDADKGFWFTSHDGNISYIPAGLNIRNKLSIDHVQFKELENMTSLAPTDSLVYVGGAGGLFAYSKSRKSLERINPTDESSWAETQGVWTDDNGYLWYQTSIGIYRFNPGRLEKTDFTREFNLPITFLNSKIRPYQSWMVGAYNNEILFFQKEFMSHTAPAGARSLELVVRSGDFTAKYINGKNPTCSLPEKTRDAEFSLRLGSIDGISDRTYFYRIKDVLDDWIAVPAGVFQLSALSPGSYQLEYGVSNGQKRIPDVFYSLNVMVAPYWYESRTFLAILFIMLLLAGIFLANRLSARLRRQKNQQREEERKFREAELIALRSQMNPHFIFNTLNGINAAILQSDKHTASEYLIQFSYMVRQVLNYTKKLETTMADELDFSKQYLELEQKRLKTNLTFHFRNEIQESDADHIIPSLSLQPFLENAIWHGLRTVDYPGHIDLHAFRKEEFIVVEILDNGVGLEKSKKNSRKLSGQKSYGIEITTDRINLQNPRNTIDVRDRYNDSGKVIGVKVTLKIFAPMEDEYGN